LGERVDVVNAGDLVEINGKVVEDFGLTRIDVSPSAVQVLSSNNVLPSFVEITPPMDNH